MEGRGSVFSGFEGCMCISPPTKSINKKMYNYIVTIISIDKLYNIV